LTCRADSTTSLDALYGAIDRAGSVVVSAYTLSSRSSMLHTLESAAARGAHVQLVVLTGEGMEYALVANHEIAAQERAFHVALSNGPLHLKAAVLNGGAGGVFLTDRNFAQDSVILVLPAHYALAIERAMIGDAHDDGNLTLTKGSSLTREAALISSARTTVEFESESFSAGNPVYDALEAAIRRHVRVSITVARNEYSQSASERELLNDLGRRGAKLYSSDQNEKLLSVDDGRIGWIGSSNATSGLASQVDWGYSTTDRSLIATIIAHLTQ
jgi:hypothetical protein